MTNSAQNFVTYFNSKVFPEEQSVEKSRKKALVICTVIAVFAAVLSALMTIPAVPSKIKDISELINPIIIFAISFCCISFTFSFFIRKIYGLSAKKRLLPLLLNFWGSFEYIPPENVFTAIYNSLKNKTGLKGIFDELTQNKHSKISLNPGLMLRLIRFENIDYDDKIAGKYNDTDIEVNEIATYYVDMDKDGRKTKRYTFKGVAFSAALNKNFKGVTAISNTHINKSDFNRIPKHQQLNSMRLSDVLKLGKQIADAAQNEDKANELKEKIEQESQKEGIRRNDILDVKDVLLEDPEFKKRFHVCSTDQIEARYILTTAFMNRFLKIASKFNYKLKAIFAENNVYIFIENRRKNWFEIPFFKSAVDINNYNEFLNDFTKLLAITDELKLNQNIGM